MIATRRNVLRLLSGAGVVAGAAGAGAATFVLTRTPHAALAAWDEARGRAFADVRMRALAWAVLAPNPHNRQPWLFQLDGTDRIIVRCDLARRLPETDPFDRQITIGFGCMLELLHQAAASQGYAATIELFPDGEPAPRLDLRAIARVSFSRALAPNPDPLFVHALDRRSNKRPFDTTRSVPADALAQLAAAARNPARVMTTADAAKVSALRDLTFRAFTVETGTPHTYRESVDLMRIGRAEIERNPDGIRIGGAMPELLSRLGVLTRETLADPASSAFAQGVAQYREIMNSGMAYVWLATQGGGRAAEIEVGREWLRLNLAATRLGLGVHPVSQALQEFREMAPLADELRRILGAREGERVQMLGRLGYCPAVGPSARWRIETRIVQL